MSRGVSNKITYKPYNQNEQWLLPPSLDELVPENHFVRTVSKTVDELDIEKIFAKNTKGGGASRYNPIMLMKVLIYCYMTGTYSSRMISKQCRENVNVMWLTGFQKPDFRTINKFRSEKLKDTIEEITHKENEVYGDKDLAELGEDITVTSEEIKEAAAKINERLAEINNLDEEETKEVKKN
jgi:transposase